MNDLIWYKYFNKFFSFVVIFNVERITLKMFVLWIVEVALLNVTNKFMYKKLYQVRE